MMVHVFQLVAFLQVVSSTDSRLLKLFQPVSYPVQTTQGWVDMPGFNCGDGTFANGGVAVYYPADLIDNSYPIVSFLHGSGGGNFGKLCHRIASEGMVVVAVHQGTCGDWSNQQIWAVKGAQKYQDLSPAFSKVNYGIVGVAGHSQGAAFTMGAAVEGRTDLNIVAGVASHGQSGNAAPNMRKDMAFMFSAGTSDPKTHKLWWAYQSTPSHPKIFYNLNGAAHMEPTHGGNSNEFVAAFLACYMTKRGEVCEKVYSDNPDSMCHKYPAGCTIDGQPDFTTTASPDIMCRCMNPGSKSSDFKCSNGESHTCSQGQICYTTDPFPFSNQKSGCATPAGDRIPVPNGGACDWGLPAEEQNCEFCEKYFDPRIGNTDGGKCVWTPSQNLCMPKDWAQQQGWDIEETCPGQDFTCSCTSPGSKSDNSMTCSNGEKRNCGSNQVCYATEAFHYGSWQDGCATLQSQLKSIDLGIATNATVI